MDYHERLRKVNANCNDLTKTVWDSIDRPIRPLVYELNRVGLRTKFSCCGFPYEGEEEPKSHHATFSYVFFHKPTTKRGHNAFAKLVKFIEDIKRDNGWNLGISSFGKGDNEVLHLWIKNHIPDLYQKTDGLEKGIHDYEGQVLAIHLLASQLKKHWKTDNEVTEIIDGNRSYHDNGIEEWQVKPKRTIAMKVLEGNKFSLVYKDNKEITDV